MIVTNKDAKDFEKQLERLKRKEVVMAKKKKAKKRKKEKLKRKRKVDSIDLN